MNKSKKYMIIGICALIFSIIGSTVAYYVGVVFRISTSTITYGLDYYINYTKGQNIVSESLSDSIDYLGGSSSDIEFWKKDNTYDIYGHIYLDIEEIGTNLSNTEALKYTVVNNGTILAEGSLIGTVTDDSVLILSNIPLQTSKQLYTIYIWIDEKETINNSISQERLSLTVRCEASMEKYSINLTNPVNLLTHIKSQYILNTPTLITHSKSDSTSDTYYYSYQDDTSTWGLMNDGLTIDTTQDATTTGLAKVVTDTTKLTSGIEGNIRYFGPNDSVNNYIYFNCKDYNDTSTCEKWRIIGIIDGKVKIIRDESIGDLSWDQDKNQDSRLTTYSNNWETSSLQLFLNGLYYNRGTTKLHTYYSGSSGTTTSTLNLTSIGITEATRTNNIISESTWYLGGKSSSSGLYPNDIYNHERQNIKGTTIYSNNPFTINANIGIMYASDYGYGTDLTKCSEYIDDYEKSANTYACRTNNWLFNRADQWLINPVSSDSYIAWRVPYSGYVATYNHVSNADLGVRPVLYLDTDVLIGGGDGTSTNPYRISVS